MFGIAAQSSRLPTVSVEFPTVLVRFRTPAYSDSVSKPVFFEPDPVIAKKYKNRSRNGLRLALRGRSDRTLSRDQASNTLRSFKKIIQYGAYLPNNTLRGIFSRASPNEK